MLRSAGLRVTSPRVPALGALYEMRTGDSHHLVCRNCRVVGDIDYAMSAVPCLTPFEVQGFVVDEAEVVG
jgi:Fur family transcriptional regulator, stress-responsive regulator